MEPTDVKTLIQEIESSAPMDSEILDSFVSAVASHSVDINLVEQWLKAVHSYGISEEDTTRLTHGMMMSGEMKSGQIIHRWLTNIAQVVLAIKCH